MRRAYGAANREATPVSLLRGMSLLGSISPKLSERMRREELQRLLTSTACGLEKRLLM